MTRALIVVVGLTMGALFACVGRLCFVDCWAWQEEGGFKHQHYIWEKPPEHHYLSPHDATLSMVRTLLECEKQKYTCRLNVDLETSWGTDERIAISLSISDGRPYP
jgi:hypothetical protein